MSNNSPQSNAINACKFDHLSQPIAETNIARPGALVISLDFELHWGVRDIYPLHAAQRAKLLAARASIPGVLELFREFSIHATWATVGYLFAHSKKEAEAFIPSKQPKYRDARLNPYKEQVGTNERDDPFHFAPSLIARIAEHEGQEIASHSFSHYYCKEQGQGSEEFESDLLSAVAIASNSGYTLRSFIFPRNQVDSVYLPCLERSGFRSYRGNECAGAKMAVAFKAQRQPHKRIARLLDAYVDVDGYQTFTWPEAAAVTSIPSSRYLRPYHPVGRPFESLRLHRIRDAMQHAALTGEIFHLWWHPEDFALNGDQNLRFLRHVLSAFVHYRTHYGMLSLSMAEVSSKSTR